MLNENFEQKYHKMTTTQRLFRFEVILHDLPLSKKVDTRHEDLDMCNKSGLKSKETVK